MKSVLISIQPKWCELIASGKKTIEVRKTSPKLDTPFKVYIYCTIGNGVKGDYLVPSGIQCGKVIGEFVCREIEPYAEYELLYGMDEISNSIVEEKSCVDIDELLRYKGKNDFIYGWHISDLKIYDKPKELREFNQYNERLHYLLEKYPKQYRNLCDRKCGICDCVSCNDSVKRPPQSWCYVESLGE